MRAARNRAPETRGGAAEIHCRCYSDTGQRMRRSRTAMNRFFELVEKKKKKLQIWKTRASSRFAVRRNQTLHTRTTSQHRRTRQRGCASQRRKKKRKKKKARVAPQQNATNGNSQSYPTVFVGGAIFRSKMRSNSGINLFACNGLRVSEVVRAPQTPIKQTQTHNRMFYHVIQEQRVKKLLVNLEGGVSLHC